jgi:hypothetical protein
MIPSYQRSGEEKAELKRYQQQHELEGAGDFLVHVTSVQPGHDETYDYNRNYQLTLYSRLIILSGFFVAFVLVVVSIDGTITRQRGVDVVDIVSSEMDILPSEMTTSTTTTTASTTEDTAASADEESNIDTIDDEYKRIRSARNATANEALGRLNSNKRKVPNNKECIVTVLITRHCNDYGLYALDDDEEGDKHCSYVGYERTKYFAQQFERSPNVENRHRRWPTPSVLFALVPDFETQSGGINYRQIEMLLPLAKKTNVGIHVVATPEQVAESIFQRLQGVTGEASDQDEEEEDVCGEVIVISWKHRFIPDVAAALGCAHDQGCKDAYPDGEFDVVWQLRFVHEPPTPQNVVANLLDEDSYLLKDDHHILKEQRLEQQRMGYPGSDFGKLFNDTVDVGWVVYGGVSFQEFDPLAYGYHPDLP